MGVPRKPGLSAREEGVAQDMGRSTQSLRTHRDLVCISMCQGKAMWWLAGTAEEGWSRPREVLFSKYHLATAQKFDLCFGKLILASDGTGLWEKETAMINCSVNIKKQLSLF